MAGKPANEVSTYQITSVIAKFLEIEPCAHERKTHYVAIVGFFIVQKYCVRTRED